VRPLRPKLAVHGRYNLILFLRVLNCSLQGVAERPLPCSYYVIQPVIALSRRKRGFESLRGRQLIQLLPRNFVRIYLHCTDYRFSLLLPETDSHSFPRLPSVTISARGFSNTFAV
jgi:hypothetical protein